MLIWSASRISGASTKTIEQLLVDAGVAYKEFHQKFVRDVWITEGIEVDELWNFNYAKEKNVDTSINLYDSLETAALTLPLIRRQS